MTEEQIRQLHSLFVKGDKAMLVMELDLLSADQFGEFLCALEKESPKDAFEIARKYIVWTKRRK